MINLSKEICLRFKEVRQAKGYNQSTLARMVGCKQSAISMFEAGMTTKLSDETVRKMAEVLGVSIDSKSDEEQNDTTPHVHTMPGSVVRGYCPNCDCPSNVPYVVGDHLLYRPMRNVASPTGGARCAQCGELLEMRCPSCGAPLSEGACCPSCGSAYIVPTVPDGTDIGAYARIRFEEIERLLSLFRS